MSDANFSVLCFQGGQQSLAAPHDPRVQRERGAALQGSGDTFACVVFILAVFVVWVFWRSGSKIAAQSRCCKAPLANSLPTAVIQPLQCIELKYSCKQHSLSLNRDYTSRSLTSFKLKLNIYI